MINIKGLSKSYGGKKVLHGIDLRLEKGRAYGIAGKNGAGKTTLFKCIAGLEHYSGKIESPLQPLKDHSSLLPTTPYFFPKITGREYLRLFCNARHKRAGDLDGKNIFQLPLDNYASTYSTGMGKKLAITAVLLQDSDLIILDEPFNGVDIQSNIIITEILRRLKGMGKTLLIASHIFSTLRDVCDEIHLLDKGVLVRKAAPAQFEELEREMVGSVVGDGLDAFFQGKG